MCSSTHFVPIFFEISIFCFEGSINKLVLILAKIRTSLFIDPSKQNIEISKKIGTKCVELHTGKISILVKKGAKFSNELKRIKDASKLAFDYDIEVHAGHGLDYKTTKILRKIPYIKEFNIGHFIIGESLESGMPSIIKEFKKIVR